LESWSSTAPSAYGVDLTPKSTPLQSNKTTGKGDHVSYMNDKVKYFPHDLKVFRRIFDLIENVYQQQIAQIFRVAMSAVQLLLALAYALLDGQKKNSDYVV
jgi:hypothetical protein